MVVPYYFRILRFAVALEASTHDGVEISGREDFEVEIFLQDELNILQYEWHLYTTVYNRVEITMRWKDSFVG